MKHGHIIHPPHAKWLRECCKLHLWPEVRRVTEVLIDNGSARHDSLALLEQCVADFNAELKLAEGNDQGAILVAPPVGMTVRELQERISFAIAEWSYERE